METNLWRRDVSSHEMKFLILITMVVLTFALAAQENEEAAVPAEKAVEVDNSERPTMLPKQEPPSADARAPRRRIARHPSPRTTPSPRPAAVRAAPAPSHLTENVTIHLRGSVNEGTPLNLSLTGIGPIFQADVVTDDAFTVLTHRYSVNPQEGGYRVEYTIGLRIRMEVPGNGLGVNYEYRDVSVVGTVIAKEGKAVVISKNGDRELSLTLAKTKE